MRILFVAMPDSIHTARWINQIADQPWDIHLFPVYPGEPHKQLRNVTIHGAPAVMRTSRKVLRYCKSLMLGAAGQAKRLLKKPAPADCGCKQAKAPDQGRLKSSLNKLLPPWVDQSKRLARVIRELKPDLIHSLEIQHSAYLTMKARRRLGDRLPPWMINNWGSDIYFFGRDPEHAPKIRAALQAADYYCAECQRDVDLSAKFGFEGLRWPVIPAAGGFHVDEMQQYRQPGPSSQRRVIALKGNHGWAGRSLVALEALKMCLDVLTGYELHVYNAYFDLNVQRAVKQFAADTGILTHLVPKCSHEDILRMHGQARVSIGLSITDGISTSVLEAMIMGSFPVQSFTSCADEWLNDGSNGLLVPPEDAAAAAKAIRRAITDNALVDQAARINLEIAHERLEYEAIQQKVIGLYESVLAQSRARTNKPHTSFATSHSTR
jgi:hypothetical protein